MTAASVYTGLAEQLSGLFTGNMASRSVGELQEMEGGLMCEDAVLPWFFFLTGPTSIDLERLVGFLHEHVW